MTPKIDPADIRVECPLCGAERPLNCYCAATPECAWYATQHRTGETNRRHGRHQIVRYPDWGRDWVVPMPLVINEQFGKVIQSLILSTQARGEYDHPLFVGDAMQMLCMAMDFADNPGTPDNPIELEAQDDKVLTGEEVEWARSVRPTATAFVGVANPGYPNPRKALSGRHVRIQGVVYKVVGVECFAIFLPYRNGMNFGLLLEEIE